jgi:uncharacterized OsmC-like protein
MRHFSAPKWYDHSVQASGDKATTDVHAQGKYHFIIDEPPSMGGKGKGANPLSHFLGALCGCSQYTLYKCAEELGVDIGHVKWRASGKLDLRGLKGEEGVPSRFQSITVVAEMDTKASKAELQQLQEMVEQRCPVANTIEATGMEFTVEYKSRDFNFVSSMGTHI